MEEISESLNKIIGKWRVTEWKNQHAFYPPDEDALDHISEWQIFDKNKIDEFPSNFIYSGIGKENLDKIDLTDIQIVFTDKYRAKLTYHFNIYIDDTESKQVFWEISKEPEYCDFSIVMGEVYNYAKCKIEKLNENELVILERVDNTESDTYFQRICFQKVNE
ncbi:hypothetical protein PXC01_10005 [Maribacter sp. M208]|uniref:hypothetical protein n=1 Tax=Maribacter huludaoensis TaxID=3030010 RepID=UPI0023EBD580|nr:hypothetical protein [Maribacter huludaoensis]MDF4221917.1 hypothetical protein [Maribacter huludaoensis]